MEILAALIPPLVVGVAFIALTVVIKRRAEAEEKDEE